MSLFDHEDYQWRETCFVYLARDKRPTAKQVEKALLELNGRFEVREIQADDAGRFESCTLFAPDAYAAIDLSYVEGEEVTEQMAGLRRDVREMTEDPEELKKAARLPDMNARIDLMHFERLTFSFGDEDDDGSDEGMFDPSALILVLERLADLCDGVPIDPQSGAIM